MKVFLTKTLLIGMASFAAIWFFSNLQRGVELKASFYESAKIAQVKGISTQSVSEIKETQAEKIYGWIPHFDFARGLASVTSNNLSESHVTGAAINETGSVVYNPNFENYISQANQKGLRFGINIISTNANNTSLFLQKNKGEFYTKIKEFKKFQNFKSVNINIENLYVKDKTLYLNFLKELKIQLKQLNLELFTTVYPRSTLVNSDYTMDSVKNYSEIANNSDYLVIMFYDSYRFNKTSPSNSPITWLENGLKEMKSENIQMEKVIIGLPLFGYGFNLSGSVINSYTYEQINKINGKFSLDQTKQEILGEKGAEKIYFLDSSGIQARKNLSQTYGVNKFFYWRLGGEKGLKL